MADSVNNNYINFIVKKVGLEQTDRALQKLNRHNKLISKEIPRATKLMSTQISYSLDKQGKSVKKLTYLWQTAEKKIKQSVFKISGTNKLLGASMSNVTNKMGMMSKGFSGIMGRAIATIPVWYALRRAFTFVLQSVGEVIDYLTKLDKALARAKAVVHGFKGTLEEAGGALRIMVRSLAVTTGRPVEKVLEIFYRLATAGIGFDTALRGISGVLKTSIAMMGDEEKVARVLAQTYNLLGKSIKGNMPEYKKIELIGAVIAKLWTKNQFELNEFSTALERVGATMNVTNVDMRTTVALLATLHQQGIRGGRAGRLLASAFDMMAKNLDKLQSELGIVVKRGEIVDWFKLFETMLNRVNDAGSAVPETVQKVLAIFRRRGAQSVRAFLTDMNKFRENLQLSRKDANELFKELDKLYKLQMNTIPAQVGIFKNLKREIGATFLTAVTGTDSFVEALKQVNYWMYGVLGLAKSVGIAIQRVGRVAREMQEQPIWKKALKGAIPAYGAIEMGTRIGKQFMGEKKGELGIFDEGVKAILDLQDGFSKLTKEQDKYVKQQEKINGMLKKQGASEEEITDSFLKRLDILELERTYMHEELAGATSLELKYRKLVDTVALIIEYHEKGVDIYGNTVDKVSEERVLTALMAGDMEEIIALKREGVLTEQEALDLVKQAHDIEKERITMTKKYGDALEKAISGGLSAFLQGEATIDEALNRIGENMRKTFADALSKGLTAKFMKMTGIGGIWGGLMSEAENIGLSIQTSSVTGSQMYSNAILQASIQGARYYQQPLGSTGGITPMMGGMPGGVPGAPGYGGAMGMFTPQIPIGRPSMNQSVHAPKQSQSGFWANKGRTPFTWGGGLMTGATGAMMNYGRGGTAMALSGVGSMLMTYGGPIGWAVGGLMMLGSLFAGKKKTTVEKTSTWKPEEVTNMFELMGMDIAPLPKLYALERSRYFGRQNPINITINTGDITGTDKDIAQKIAQQVSISMSKVTPVDYRRSITRGGMANKILF